MIKQKRILNNMITRRVQLLLTAIFILCMSGTLLGHTQLGADIDGEANDDFSGFAVSMSADGSRVAIGAPGNDGNGERSGHVRVYSLSGATWVQLGADINGEASGDDSGMAVSMSADGNLIAVGAGLNDGNGFDSGHISIYSWSGTTWEWRGEINGEAAGDESGTSVSMSANGNRIAVGAELNNGNGSNSGHVRVYDWTGVVWAKLGADIDGEASSDKSGFSVSMSADGSRIAIGAQLNDGNGISSGHVRIYSWSDPAWVQLGTDIDGEAAGDRFATSVSMSADGSRVAIGAEDNAGNGTDSGHVRVYSWSGSAWEQFGTDIDGEAAHDRSGFAVSMSADGSRVAISATNNDDNGSLSGFGWGHVRVYSWSGSDWVQFGVDIDGEAAEDISGRSVSMSADGARIAIGAHRNDGNGSQSGHVRVYEITAANTAPVANNDAFNATEDTLLNIAAVGVLNDDTDGENDLLSAVLNTTTGNGSLTLNADGSFSYDPTHNYCGPDSFTYHANDGFLDSNVATVSITVGCVNDKPIADNDTYNAVEDTQLVVAEAGVLIGDIDWDGDSLTVKSNTPTLSGIVAVASDGSFTYDPAENSCGAVAFSYIATDNVPITAPPMDSDPATVVISIACVNDAPVADNDAYDATEDTLLVIAAAVGVLNGDTDGDGDSLTVKSNTAAGHGTVVLASDGSFTYDPEENYCGMDSFTYIATDDEPETDPAMDSEPATVSITVACVNDPPTVTGVTNAAQTSDYSDFIGTVTIVVDDVDDTTHGLIESMEPSASEVGLTLMLMSCVEYDPPTASPAENGSTCTWTYDGQVLDPGYNVHNILFTPSDGDGPNASGTDTHTLTIHAEDATVMLDAGNDVAVEVAVPDGNSGTFILMFTAYETNNPDASHDGLPKFGDLNNAEAFMSLVPVGPGGPITVDCSISVDPVVADYDQMLTANCDFDDVPVNTYEVLAEIDGADGISRYYYGVDEGVFVVYDPSLGFTTGGGWFYWPETADPELAACGPEGYLGDKTNFGFNMKYNKKHTKIQGSLLLMQHTVDANCLSAGNFKVKSNALDGLAIGGGTDDGSAVNYGWAAFSGKATYREPSLDNEGNHLFLVYVEDRDEQGCNQDPVDEFWIEVRDKDGMVVMQLNGDQPADEDPAFDSDDEPIECGNIIVPHKTGGKGGGGGRGKKP